MTLCNYVPDSLNPLVNVDLPEGVPPLKTIFLYLTACCNLRCRHCWVNPVYEGETLKPDSYIDLADLKSAIKEGQGLGLSNIKLTGGEPILHPHFREIVTFLTEENLFLHMESNGTLITPELARFLREDSNVSFISVVLILQSQPIMTDFEE